MTALLELKQKIKNLYGQYEIYILPFLRFVLALVYFLWINANMGYMTQLNNIFIVLILALICSILPSGVMIFVGFVLMIAHSYAVGIEVAGFMLVLILFMTILFLRFSAGNNLVLVLFSVLTYIQYTVKYRKAKKSVKSYYEELTQLNKIYSREEKKSSIRGVSGGYRK